MQRLIQHRWNFLKVSWYCKKPKNDFKLIWNLWILFSDEKRSVWWNFVQCNLEAPFHIKSLPLLLKTFQTQELQVETRMTFTLTDTKTLILRKSHGKAWKILALNHLNVRFFEPFTIIRCRYTSIPVNGIIGASSRKL